ncbi:MAG: SGNH/GDSL hydrolase family protein [Rhodoblastus sp.]|nr:SGNH/GDSL hydrolase family protein [Rhodoblastus sp.]
MARKVAGLFFASLTFVGSAALAAQAEDAVAPKAGEPPPLSAQCQAPASDIAAPAPLPNFAAVLAAKKKARVLAIGSSSTYGVGASSRSRNYPSQLHEILGKALNGVDVEIINRGVSGEVAATTAERIRTEVAVLRPDLVLWQLGTNDALSRVPPDQFEATVRSTVDWLKADKIDVVLVGLQYTPKLARDKNYEEIRDTLFKISAQEGVLYIRRYDAMRFIAQARAAPVLAQDEFHLNDLGYRCMAEHVAQAVIANLFVRRFRPTSGNMP